MSNQNEYKYTLTDEETEELVVLANRLRDHRLKCQETMVTDTDEQVRENFRILVSISEDLNELYKRTIVKQMIASSGDNLGRCMGYHFQMAEAVAVSMAQLCMSDEERAKQNAFDIPEEPVVTQTTGDPEVDNAN